MLPSPITLESVQSSPGSRTPVEMQQGASLAHLATSAELEGRGAWCSARLQDTGNETHPPLLLTLLCGEMLGDKGHANISKAKGGFRCGLTLCP